MAQHPTFVITMEDGRQMKGELYPEIAPQSVGNLCSAGRQRILRRRDFSPRYSGLYDPGAATPRVPAWAAPATPLRVSLPQNGVKNDLKHTYGVLSMARNMRPDSAGSQFFIMTSDSPHLDGAYAAFGKVLEGMEVAEDIVNTRRDYNDRPMTPRVMKSVRVETYGVDYPFEQM